MNSILHIPFHSAGRRFSSWGQLPVVATTALMLVLLGCGSDKPAAAKQGSGVAAKAGAAPAASVAPANPSNAVAIVKSTFHTDPKFGRDPFFPGSRRDTGGSADGGSMAQLPL